CVGAGAPRRGRNRHWAPRYSCRRRSVEEIGVDRPMSDVKVGRGASAFYSWSWPQVVCSGPARRRIMQLRPYEGHDRPRGSRLRRESRSPARNLVLLRSTEVNAARLTALTNGKEPATELAGDGHDGPLSSAANFDPVVEAAHLRILADQDPGAFHEDAANDRVALPCDVTVADPVTAGVLRGSQPGVGAQRFSVGKAGEVHDLDH